MLEEETKNNPDGAFDDIGANKMSEIARAALAAIEEEPKRPASGPDLPESTTAASAATGEESKQEEGGDQD